MPARAGAASPGPASPGRLPLSRSGWPAMRTPRWLLAAAAVLAAGLVAAAIPHHPSSAQRAADLRAFTRDVNTDIESCAGGVRDSLTALRAIQSGKSHDVGTAEHIATYGAANCSPANSMPMEDLVQYQVTSSLASFHLEATVNDLVTWAFPLAQRVQSDVAAILAAGSPAARSGASTHLRRDRARLDAERATIDRSVRSAAAALSARVAPPALPG